MHDSLLTELDHQLNAGQPAISTYKATLKAASSTLAERFHDNENVVDLVHARSLFIDAILQRIWQSIMPKAADAALIAVGGYGRGELHPGSDVDVLILTSEDPQSLAEPIESLVMLLWDIGLEVGHSVRSLEQCVEEAADLTIATNLMESRLLAGQPDLFDQLNNLTNVDKIWPSDQFFSAKLIEQQTRHSKANDSGNDLEPNIKTNPGGLRDIQLIGWVAKRHFGATRLSDLKTHKFLTEQEYLSLKEGEYFLWRVRFALHVLTGRHEDRLLFEHQRILAKEFGYSDEESNLGVEQFMQQYYRTVVELQRLNEMLLQLFQEAILLNNELGEPQPINRRFQARSQYLEIIDPATFAHTPLALIEIFLLLQLNPELKGVRANTIRAVRAHRHLVTGRLQENIAARSLFMEILRQPCGLTHELRRMHRYGILERYIPAFEKITGLMQFDLFHRYTVDEHILMVVRNMRRASLEKHRDECELCFEIMQQLAKPELLYLAGLFHDIAKGRGGEHSRLGAIDARAFCLRHDLSDYDAELVGWLVDKHLNMSSTAQRKDIDDPEIIQAFAEEMGDQQHLDYLYLLTAADMRGTNPELWNSWKSSLLGRLHRSTSAALQRGLDQPESEDQVIQQAQTEARDLLAQKDLDQRDITLFWMELSTEYFLQTPSPTIAWHTEKLLQLRDQLDRMHVFIRINEHLGCSEIFVFGPDRDNLFAQTVTLLDQMNFNIFGAHIDTGSQHLSINSYFVLDENGNAISDDELQAAIEYLSDRLNTEDSHTEISHRIPRQLKSFVRESQIKITQDENRAVTQLNILTQDRPGTLSTIGTVFTDQELRLRSARISTEGEKAHDIFAITDRNDQPITAPHKLSQLKQALIDKLDNNI